MTKFINEENLTEAAKIIKQYVDENSGGDIDLSNYYTKSEADSTFLKQRIDTYTGVYEQDGIIMTAGTAPNGSYVQVLRNGDISIAVTDAERHLTLRGASNEVKLGDDTFTINGKPIATLEDTLTTQELQALIDNVLYPKPAYTLKLYTEENVGASYNSIYDGYAYVEMGAYPQSRIADDVTVTVTSGTEGITGALATGSDGARYYYQEYRDNIGGDGWFKIEPLRWLILATSSDLTDIATYGLGANNHSDMPETGSQLLLLSEYVLFGCEFNAEPGVSPIYGAEDCLLSTILDGGFAEMAGLSQYFGDYIPATNLISNFYEDNSGYNSIQSTNYIFSLDYTGDFAEESSTFDVQNYFDIVSEKSQAAGFCSEFSFAKMGAIGDDYTGYYWLRSSYYDEMFYQTGVYSVSGQPFELDAISDYPAQPDFPMGVRPSFILNLKGEKND